jgi:hypothetical protein
MLRSRAQSDALFFIPLLDGRGEISETGNGKARLAHREVGGAAAAVNNKKEST